MARETFIPLVEAQTALELFVCSHRVQKTGHHQYSHQKNRTLCRFSDLAQSPELLDQQTRHSLLCLLEHSFTYIPCRYVLLLPFLVTCSMEFLVKCIGMNKNCDTLILSMLTGSYFSISGIPTRY